MESGDHISLSAVGYPGKSGLLRKELGLAWVMIKIGRLVAR
jgi:hypothetical protein